MMKISSLLLFVLQWHIDLGEEYVITRKYRDTFTLPMSQCSSQSNWKQKCVEHGGRDTQRNCTCVCNRNRYFAFGFFENSWKCVQSPVVRSSGCKDKIAILNGRVTNAPLIKVTVPIDEDGYRYIGYVEEAQASDCQLENAISYLDCDGKWNTTNQDPLFGFHSTFNNGYFYLNNYDNNAFDTFNPRIYGYILKLSVLCKTHLDTELKLCIFLKIDGVQTCPITLPTTTITTPNPTTTAQSSLTQVSSSSSRHSPTTTSTVTSTTTSTTTSSSTQSTTFSSTTTSTSNPISTLITPKFSSEAPSPKTGLPIFTTQISKHRNSTKGPLKGGDGETADQSAIIAGPIVGVTALITIVIILIFVRVWMKRKKREACDGVAQNPVYDGVVPSNSSVRPGQQTSTDDEYSYAYTNTHPVVIRDQHGKALQGPHFPNGHVGEPSSSDFPIYNTLEDPDYAELSKTQDKNSGPSYNVLERRPETNWNTIHSASGSSPNSEAPVYNTLEDPDYAKLSKTKDSQSGPSYNILERRPNANWNKQKGPLYDVVEKTNSASGSSPNSEDPIYNTLEDPDYASLGQSDNIRIGPSYDILEGPEVKRAMTQGSPFYDVLENPNSTGSPVYDVLEQPESDEQHVYGSLQNNDPHIYGALQSPTSHNEEANSGYDDDYNFAGDVIHYDGDGDVYQELNQDGQRSSDDVYEPLHHSRVLIGMKDMNEKPQSRA